MDWIKSVFIFFIGKEETNAYKYNVPNFKVIKSLKFIMAKI